MNHFLLSLWHGIVGHPEIIRHMSVNCHPYAVGKYFCRVCKGHFEVRHPPIGDIKL